MCSNEALANQIVALVEQKCVEDGGVFDREKALAYITAYLCSTNATGEVYQD